MLHLVDTGPVNDNLGKANIQCFSNFNHPSSSSTLKNDISTNNFENLELSNFPEDFLCTEEKMFSLIASLDANKSSGVEGISKMLKSTAPCIAESLASLFNKWKIPL